MEMKFLPVGLALTLIYCSVADPPQVGAQEIVTRAHLREIRFTGNNQMPPAESKKLAKSLQTRTFEGPNWLNEVAESTRDFWQNHGYFNAKVQPQAEPLPERNNTQQFAVTLVIEEGAQYRLSAISLKNNKAISNTPALRNLFPIADGEVFRTSAIRSGLEKMRHAYGDLGYINFTSVPDTQVDDDQHTIKLIVDLDEGKPFYVRNIEFLGLAPDLIAKLRSRFFLKPGDVYNARLLELSFKQNAHLLPRGSAAEKNIYVTIDNQAGVLDITLKFPP